MSGTFDERLVVSEATESSLIYNEHLTRYELAKNYVKGRTVLDVACGSGYGAYLLAQSDAKQILAVDIDKTTLELADKRYHHEKIEFLVDNVEVLSKIGDKLFDVIVSFETIEHLSDTNSYLQQLKRVLKDGGMALISTPNKEVFGQKNPWHLKEFAKEEFYSELSKYFKNVVILEQYNVLANIINVGATDNQAVIQKSGKALYFIALVSDSDIQLPQANIISLNQKALLVRDNNLVWRLSNKVYSLVAKLGIIKK